MVVHGSAQGRDDRRDQDRRDADPQSPSRLFALLLRADPDRAAASRGERFCREVLAATDIEGLDRAWSHPENLPTAEELDEALESALR